MACIAWALERDEGVITLGLHLLPDWYNGPDAAPDHMAEAAGRKEHFDELHKRKIDLADQVLVCNIDGYIGDSTKSEIAYARAHGKPVRFLEPELAAHSPSTAGATGVQGLDRECGVHKGLGKGIGDASS